MELYSLLSLAAIVAITLIAVVQSKTITAQAAARRFPQYRKMSRMERKLLVQFHLLPHSKLWKESPWQLAVQIMIDKRSVTRFRKLASEMRSQCQDNPALMVGIVGRKIYALLVRLHPVAGPGKVISLGGVRRAHVSDDCGGYPEAYEANLGHSL